MTENNLLNHEYVRELLEYSREFIESRPDRDYGLEFLERRREHMKKINALAESLVTHRMPEGHYLGHPNVRGYSEKTCKYKESWCNDCLEPWFIHFRITDELWARVTSEPKLMLCQPCTEKRLGRPLVASDFEGHW